MQDDGAGEEENEEEIEEEGREEGREEGKRDSDPNLLSEKSLSSMQGDGGGEEENEERRKDTDPNLLSEKSLSKISNLYEKYSVLCNEVERLEKQNSDYRDQLVKSIRDREHHQEQLDQARSEGASRIQELERRLLEFEYQLKATRDRYTAQETHSARVIAEQNARFNAQLLQLTRRNEVCENEKNDAVIKYAQREAELMRLKQEGDKSRDQIRSLIHQRDTLLNSCDETARALLQKTVDDLRMECSRQREELTRFDSELKMAEKRVQIAQSTIQETKWQLDTAQHQIARLTEEKDAARSDYRKLITQLQTTEMVKSREDDQKKRDANDREQSVKALVDELNRARDRVGDLSRQLDEATEENSQLQSNCSEMGRELRDARDQLNIVNDRLKQLETIETQVNRSQRAAERAERERIEALNERDQAEAESAECRAQAERMLNITEQLTEKNSRLTSDCDSLRAKNRDLSSRISDLEEESTRVKQCRDDLERQLEQDRACSKAELKSLQDQLNAQIVRVQDLTKLVEDAENDKVLLRRKHAANVKELRTELSNLQRHPPPPTVLLSSENGNGGCLSTMENNGSTNMGSSRTSSITSLDQAGRQPALPCHSQSSPEHVGVQQAMLDKIIKLQRQLARRQDKVEFLEEHVKQCVDELQKKTKIIQHFALREEASLLLPDNERDINRVMELFEMVEISVSNRRGMSYALMGSMFMGTGAAEKKSAIELAAEVNARLQAVIEDLLIKNVALKSNVDTLGEEISRLSRENRQMSLSIYK